MSWTRTIVWCWLGLALLLTACAKRAAYTSDDMAGGYGEAAALMETRAARAPAMAKGAPAPSMAMDMEAPSSEPAPPPKADRMVHYDGYAELRVTRVEDAIVALEALASEAGGAIEQIYGGTVTLRVPVDAFEATFAKVLTLGDVLDERITAEDVTESFTAVDLRLRTAKATRDRLVDLLAKATTDQEKLQLVREIQRLSEEIDRTQAQVRALADLAARSRITCTLHPREALGWQQDQSDTSELAWIRQLSPFRRDVAVPVKPLMLDVPDGMVALDLKRAFVAESADGARVWAHRLDNAPEGDADFWLEALRARLAREFGKVTDETIGDWKVLTLVDRGDEPYTWMIAVRVTGRNLDLAQVWLPSAEHAARHTAAVRTMLQAGGDS
jgi:hypothetical protein